MKLTKAKVNNVDNASSDFEENHCNVDTSCKKATLASSPQLVFSICFNAWIGNHLKQCLNGFV